MGWPGPVTHRQHLAQEAWLLLDLNEPSRSDVYLMQLALKLDRLPYMVWAAFGATSIPPAKMDDYRLQFERRAADKPKLTPEQEAARSKSAWLAATGAAPGVGEMEETESTLPEPYRAKRS